MTGHTGTRPDPPMSTSELQAVIDQTCTTKTRHASPGSARRVAFAARVRTGEAFSAYRCPFAGGTRATAHWHVGRVPSLAALEKLATAIRQRAQGAA